MVGLFGTLGTANSGLNASDIGLQTAANNISNAGTEGYSRQRVNLHTKLPYTLAGVGSIGTGVKVDGVKRDVSDYIRQQIRVATSKQASATQRSTTLGNLEDILNEPSDNGVINQLANLSKAWTSVANDPEMTTTKSVVLEHASSFVDAIHNMASSITNLKNTTVNGVAQAALDFNKKLETLNELNTQIYNSYAIGETPNTLLDSRDQVLKELSGLADISTVTDEYNRVSVYLGENPKAENVVLDSATKQVNNLSVVSASQAGKSSVIVDGDITGKQVELPGDYPAGTLLILKQNASGAYSISKEAQVVEGDLGGYQDALAEINSAMTELNNFTNTIVKTINLVYNSNGTTSPEKAGLYKGFFTLAMDSQNPAVDFAVDKNLLANPALLRTGTTTASGDSSIATAIVAAFAATIPTDGSDASVLTAYDPASLRFKTNTSGSTYATRFNNIVTTNGIAKQKADNTQAAQDTLLNSLNQQDQSVSGVSINEEMADVIRYQNAFQANARMMQVVADCLDTLINKTGV
ncbi:flagellar hook-associated protein FlgK [Lactobacillus agilis]|uniref:Flagellar hook-associated protein 1 n=1 Tax=Ligilactobacillus agilis TaxID=1601 RepID=A0A848C3M1_9LACO|nr:flagellar hook-associated protein FlgK [Ligilactobacillus agilis]NME42023.1 flagellar hook-associated protein FlgK [Ligilactobacillus agilis]